MAATENIFECPICLRFKSDIPNDYFVNTSCGHLFHFRCVTKCITIKRACPSCNQNLNYNSLTKIHGMDPSETCNIQPHSKRASILATRLPTLTKEYYEFEITLLGDSGVGKSCLINRYVKGGFDDNQKATVGTEVNFQYIQVAGNLIKLKLWDTSGQERFRCMNQNHVRNSHGVLLVYSYNRKNIQESIKYWNDYITDYGKPGTAKIIVGNMTDLPERQRTFSTRQGQQLANSFGLPFYETSARDFYNVEATFTALVAEILSKVENNQLLYLGPTRENLIRLHENPRNKSSSSEPQSEWKKYFDKFLGFFNCFD